MSDGSIFDTLKVRVKYITVLLDIINDYETKEAVSDLGKPPQLQFFQASAQLLQSVKLKSKDVCAVLEKAGIKYDLRNTQRILLSWLDQDTLNFHASHVFVLFIGLLLAREWTETMCKTERVRDRVLQPVNEVLFSIIPYLHGFNILNVALILQTLLPLSLVPEELEKLAAEESKQVELVESLLKSQPGRLSLPATAFEPKFMPSWLEKLGLASAKAAPGPAGATATSPTLESPKKPPSKDKKGKK